MTRKLLDDCFLHDSERLTHAEAIAILRERIAPVTGVEQVPVDAASGRVLAADVIAPRDIPAHTNSAVDGYAFAFADYDADMGSTFTVSARAAAGHAASDSIEQGTAARIFTGAALPDVLDSVVMQEDTDCETRDGQIRVAIPGGLRQGTNRRLAGEDVKKGAAILTAGCRLRPQEAACAAAAA